MRVFSEEFPLPRHGVLGLFIVLIAEALLWLRVEPLVTFFTPIVWTGFVLLADGMVFWRTGDSLFQGRRQEFVFMALWSVPVWLIFEGYNLRLKNWYYVGLPANRAVEILGYLWAFATILPAVLEAEELLAALGVWRRVSVVPKRLGPQGRLALSFLGLLLVGVPWLVPKQGAQYLFGLVWIGFIFLCDPITYGLGGDSLLKEWERGEAGRVLRLLAAGALCGFLWEFWNYWAGAKWHYTLPPPLDWGPRVFEMPWLGFLGFPPFAVECYCLHKLGWTLWQRLTGWRNQRRAR
jgi:hypothetical protein